MAQSPYIINVTQASFRQEVVERSHQVPVLVDFWASWCQPCQILLPVLTALAEEYAGGFILAKVDTEAEQALAAEHGIRSIPTLKLFRNGQVVEEVMGAQPEAVFRKMIEQHRDRPSNAALDQAQALWDAGKQDEALTAVNQAWLDDRDNHRLAVTLALWLLELQRIEEAQSVVDALPADAAGVDLAGLKAKLRFGADTQGLGSVAELQSAVEADPSDVQARYDLAMARVAAGEEDAGLKHLLEIMGADPAWNEGAARKAMLDVLALLGPDDPRVGTYRRAMFAALH